MHRENISILICIYILYRRTISAIWYIYDLHIFSKVEMALVNILFTLSHLRQILLEELKIIKNG